jgi:predicted kinase
VREDNNRHKGEMAGDRLERPSLILLCGLRGAGKSTLARRLATVYPAIRLCPDEWMARLGVDLFDEAFRARLEAEFWALAKDVLSCGASVILEWGFWLKSERDEKRIGARTLGASVELRYLKVPFDELVRRVEERGRQGGIAITKDIMSAYPVGVNNPDSRLPGL